MKDLLLKLRENPVFHWAGKQLLRLRERFLRRPIVFDLLLCAVLGALAEIINISSYEDWVQASLF